MSSSRDPQNAAEDPSAAGTVFYSTPTATGLSPAGSPRLTGDVVGTTAQQPPLVNPRSEPATPQHSPMRLTSHIDADGRTYMRDQDGNRFDIVPQGNDEARSQSSRSEERPGVPAHHSILFGSSSDQGEPSSKSVLSESTPREGTEEYPPLALDIDPDLLESSQIAQLNAIRGHIGTLGSRLAATTAIVVEHQATTEDTQDAIQALRTEVISHVDSLHNEVNSQQLRLNRCLDDNLRILRDAGTSGSQIQEILCPMGRNNGAHRRDREAPASLDHPSVAPKAAIPVETKAVMDTIIPPRAENESQAEFDNCAAATLCTKESAHTAFPLPEADAKRGVPPAAEPKVTRFLPAADYQLIGSASRVIARSDIARLKGNQFLARQMERDQARPKATPVPLNDTPSVYVSGTGRGGRDAVADFADEASAQIRHTIESRVGTHLELPPGVRAPKVLDPPKYRGQDDHDFFTVDFLEKVLAWMRAGTYSGPELDWYRVVLIQNYLEGEAHWWHVTEVNAYAQENNGDSPAFADMSRFMTLLPKWITKELRLRRGFTVEFTDLETLRTHARKVWEVDTGIHNEEYLSNDRTRQQHRDRNTPTTRNEYPRNDHQQNRQDNRVTTQQHDDRDSHPKDADRHGTKAPHDGNVKVCFLCGGDHYTQDKVCPNYGKHPNPKDVARCRLEN
ncbi:hypothetical protein FB451DRAFT_1175554 [Mycena latifolia]|nr:hypothetical protein FB451DRAFT_1175554 [Mycena latifolia]